jgi:hypothetical protein
LVRRQQANLLAVETKVGTVFEGFDALALQSQGSGNLSQWKGVRLAGYFNQQCAEHRECERQLQLNAQAAAGLCAEPKIATHAPHHILHYVEADATAGDLGNGILEREAWQEKEFEQFGLGKLFSDSRRRQILF